MELEALHLKVRGQFTLVGYEKGSRTTNNVTPTGQKQRGLLDLLACSSNRTLSRHWLRQHLWSDRGNEQAQASLLKALQSLKAIDCRPFELIVNAQTAIRFSDHIELDTSGIAALFEDLDTKDPMFNDLLSKLRHGIDGTSDTKFNVIGGIIMGFNELSKFTNDGPWQYGYPTC